MKSKFRCVGLVGKYPSAALAGKAERTAPLLLEIADFLQAEGCAVALEQDTAASTGIDRYPILDTDALGAQCDLGLVVGGDGTMLGIGRRVAHWGIPLIGINQGRLGFVTDIPLDAYADVLRPMLWGEYEEDVRSLMHAHVVRRGECIFEALAMNDVVVNRAATSGMVELRVEVDGYVVANQRADGLIIATSTGSTAYALSAGGPLLHPAVAGWILVPIAPHTLSNRPLVLSDASQVAIEIVAGRDPSASFDMQSLDSLRNGDRIVVRKSEHRVTFLHPRGWSYFDTLRKKLHWNEGGS